jgi:hypothetical protein
MDASAMRAYLQSRGLSALPQSTSVVLQPDDKSCTTVNIVQPVGIRTTCTPPMVPGPVPGQCVCPLGTTLVGRECVKAPPPPPVCAPPLVPDPVAGQCICPLGTTLVGRECVPAGVHTSAPATCDPSTTLKRGDDCACRYPGMMKSSAGACMCIMGDFMPGRGCVRRIDCRLPMVSNAAGTACGCPEGTKQHGKECVRPTTTVCNPPAKLNRRGGCDCPKDTVAKSNGCVEREHRTPAIAPGDFIRNLPGGGRNNPGGPRGGGQGPTDLPGRR